MIPEVKTVVVTGANSGLGLALCERLLTTYPDVRLIMVCRNEVRGNSARDALLLSHPGADVHLILADVGLVKSTIDACKEIKKLASHIDFLFLNAGVMGQPKVNYGRAVATFFQPSKLVHRFSTGLEILETSDGTTAEGYKLTFATNVLGHYAMIKELDNELGGMKPSRIVWTSSSNADKESFSAEDIQHRIGLNPYGASKCLIDHLSVVLTENMRQKNVMSNTMCPGLFTSGLTLSILPWWFLYFVFGLFKLLRFLVPHFTLNPYNGAEALIWLTSRDDAELDPRDKYYSCCSAFGNPYTIRKKMDINTKDAESCYKQLEELVQLGHSKLS